MSINDCYVILILIFQERKLKMECLQFSILRFGIYESAKSVREAEKETSPERMTAYYEFEFYTEDYPGGRSIDGTDYFAKRGCCALVKPGQRQAMRSPYKCCFLNLATQDAELCALLDHLPNYFPLWNLDEVVELIQKMVTVEPVHALTYRALLQGYACRIIAILSQYRQTSAETAAGALRHQVALMAVDQYMREHLSEPLTLEKLAKQCNLDPTYFHKLFSASYGRTPAQQLLNYRIMAAQRGLIADDLPMHELAARCGFSSQTYFGYKFKQVVGMTPTQYRKHIRSNLK